MTIRKMLVAMSTALMSVTAVAQDATPPAAPAAQAAAMPAMVAPQPAKLKLREGTEVALVFVDAISSATNGAGDRFNLRVDDNIKVDGVVVIPRDAIAVGTVTSATKRGFMGKAGELNVILDYVRAGDERVRVRASKGKQGEGKVGATVALTVLFGPLGLLKRGKDIEIKPGTPITAFVDSDVELVPLP